MLSIFLLTILLFAVFWFVGQKPRHKFWGAFVLVLFNLWLIEVISYGHLLWRIKEGSNFYMIGNQAVLDSLIRINLFSRISLEADSPNVSFEIDNDLGYQPRPNKSSFQYKEINIQRMRAVRPYTLVPPKDKLRMAAFGDSFVYCDGELTTQTWTYFLEQDIKNLEVLNFGVSGYGLAQSYLRFINYGLRYNPDIVLFNYVETTDRDQTPALSILGGRSLVNADLYRVNVVYENDFLFSKSYNALDLFNADFRERYIYAPLGFTARTMPFSNKFFAVSNFGVFLKQWLAPKYFEKYAGQQKPLDIKVNVKILKNILRIAEYNKIMVVFFYGKPFGQLPVEIQQILNEYSANMVYVNSEDLLSRLFALHKVRKEDVLNATRHFNPSGNRIYMQAIEVILKSRAWGRAERSFNLDPDSATFIPAGKTTH